MDTPTLRIMPPTSRASRPPNGGNDHQHRARSPFPSTQQPNSSHWSTHLRPTPYVQTKDGRSMSLSPQLLNHPAYPYVRITRPPSVSSAPACVHGPCPRCLEVHEYLVFPEHVFKTPLGERIKRWLKRNGCRIKDRVVEGWYRIDWKLTRK